MSLADRFRARALSHDPEELQESTQEDLVGEARRSFLEGVRRFDPTSAFETSLDLRLTGSQVHPGALTFDTASAIFHQIQAEVREALPPGADRAVVELEMVGVSEGSAIIHARPATPPEERDDELQFPISVLDSAMQRIFDLHDALEASADLAEVTSVSSLLDRLRQLTSDLDRHDVNLELVWRSSSGRDRTSALTEHGRARARQVFEKKETDQLTDLHGTIYAASLDGEVTLRVRRQGKPVSIKVKDVDGSLLSTGALALGRFARVQVTLERRADSVGLQESSEYRFVRLISVDESLEDLPEE